MQQYKSLFKNKEHRETFTNVQECIRLNDYDLIGDGTHQALFRMIGLFSFREMSVRDSITFWMNWLITLGIEPTHVTIHPDKLEWKEYYPKHKIVLDSNCTWSDGDSGGYCTEFYVDDLEIGNIVNNGGDSIDCGFGLDRLLLCLGEKPLSRNESLYNAALNMWNNGIKPGPNGRGYVLRKIIRDLNKSGFTSDLKMFVDEVNRQIKIRNRYETLKEKHSNKSKEWWYETHGIDINLL